MRDYIPPDEFNIPEINLFDFESGTNEAFKVLENIKIQLYRESKDKKNNVLGITLLDICRNNNLFMLNGRYGNDKNVGQFTFRDKSVIDYVLATANCFKLIQDFSIDETDKLFFNGHAILRCSLSYKPKANMQPDIQQINTNLIWNENLKDKFVKNIDETDLKLILEEIGKPRSTPENTESITS